MDPGDSSQSPGHPYFDAASLLGSPYGVPTSAAAAAAAAYAHFAHIPSAYSMLGSPHLPPGLVPQNPFGGLGSLGENMVSPGLRSPVSMASSLSPTTGGAAWWRAASEQARFAAASQHLASAKLASTLNGAYSSMFQVPTLSTTASSSSTSSKTTSSSSKKETKSSSASREREKDLRSPSRSTMSPSTKTERGDKTKEEEMVLFDPMKFASAMFPYGVPSASAAQASMYHPSLFSFPFGTPYSHMGMFPGLMPTYVSGADSSSTMHSPTTTTASGRSTLASSHPTTSTSSSSHHKSSSSTTSSSATLSSSSSSHHRNSPTTSRKKLFSDHDGSSERSASAGSTSSGGHPKDSATEVLNFSTKKSDLPPVPKLTKIPVPSHLSSISSPKSKDDQSKEGSIASSISDQSDGEHDETKTKSSLGMSVPLKIPKRPASPDQVQDLSIKKKRTSESPVNKSTSSARTDSRWSESKSDKSKADSHSKSSSDQYKSDLAKSEQQYLEQHLSELQLAHQLAASGYSELLAAHMPGKLSPHLFMHPAAAAMMFPPGMLDGSGLLMPPPPPSSSGRGRGRGRGRGSRGGRARRSASPVPNGTIGSDPPRRSRGRGRKSGDVPQSGRSRQSAAQSQLSAQHEQLRAQLEAHLRTQQYLKAKEKQDQSQNKQVGDSKLAQALMGQPFPSKKGDQKVDPKKSANQKPEEESDDLSSNSDSDSDSNSDSDNESLNSDSDGENSSQASDTASTPGKRVSESKGSPNKRRKHTIADEKELRIPLEHGWRRQTRVHSIGPRGFSGEIVYYASCGKKLKSYNEVLRYLQKNEITDLARENFSFSMNLNIGEFLEAQPGKTSDDGENGFVTLNEDEVLERFLLVQQKKQAKILAKQERAARRAEKKRQAEEMSQRMAEARLQKKMEQQEMARRVADMKVHRKMERQKARDSARQEKVLHALQIKQMKEQEKMMRQQEKMKRQEQLRQEREMRAQQIVEMKQRKKQEEEQMRMMETLKRAKEREMKRQQAVYIKEQDFGGSSSALNPVDPHSIWKSFVAGSATCGGPSAPFSPPSSLSYSSLVNPSASQERERRRSMMVMVSLERERRRQHMLLVKALETRRRHEERERLKEEKKEERRKELEKKLEQRRVEEEKERELRRPVEDMSLKELKDLPEIDRLKGARLPGQALADCLMVVEFLNNFKDALDMDGDTLPSLQDLQGALQDDEDYNGEFLSLTSLLLSMAIEDPGVPNNKESVTESGQKITDMEISDDNVSEVLRIFMRCRLGKEDEMCKRLRETPLHCFVATHRAQVLAYLCNELLNNKAVTAEIEGHIDTISNCRKERWIAENKIRKLKMIQIRKFKRSKIFNDSAHEESNVEPAANQKTKTMSDEEEEESGNESDVTNATAHSDGEEDESLNQDELEKKIEKMQKQFDSYGTKAFNTGHKLRATDFGQDRFRRRYWVLPHCGGVFVEGLESAEPEEENVQAELEMNAPPESPQILNKDDEKENNQNAASTDIKDCETVHKKDNCDITDQENRQLTTNSQPKDTKENHDNINLSSCQSQSDAVKYNDNLKGPENLDLKREEPMEIDTQLMQNGENTSLSQAKDLTNDTVKSEGLQNGHIKEECLAVKNEQLSLKEEPIAPKLEKEEMLNGSLRSELGHGDSLFRKVDQFFERDLLTRKDGLKKEELLNGTHDDKDLKSLQGLGSPLASRPDTKYTDLIISLSKQVPAAESPPQRSILDASLKLKTESPSSFRSVESMIDSSTPNSYATSTPTSTNTCSVFGGMSPVPGSQVTAEQILRTLSSRSQGTWFSVLPRSPCDNQTVTTCHREHGMDSPLHQRWYANSPASFMSASYNDCSQISSRASTPFNSTLKSDYSRCDTPTAVLDETLFQKTLEAKQYKEPRPIPKPKRRGWWRIMQSKQLKEIIENLHPRGIRERMLLRKMETTQDFANSSCGKGSKDATEIEETDESQEIEKSELGVAEMDDLLTTDKEAVHEINLLMLKHVEALQERMINASLQVKGCPSLTKATEDEAIDLVSEDVPNEETRRRNVLDTAKEMLLLLESNIERRYLKPPFSKGIQVTLANMNSSSSRASPGPDEDDEDDTDDAPPALLRWRTAVARAINAAQLCLYTTQLEENIAWEKSIMKVACQICSKDDNEAQLLLCDSCDKGYHTYCFKPRMDNIPDGDWFCFECISKATNDVCCVKCGKKLGKLVTCNKCPRKMHLDCMDPPLPRMPRRWTCLMCTLEKGKRGRKKSISKVEKAEGSGKETKADGETSDNTPHPTPEKKPQKSKHEEIKADQIRGLSNDPSDLTVCCLLLAEMEKHSDSWPFLKPVNTKQFPSYRKYIKQPMDFHTMHIKLRDNIYKLRSEFATDARLVFNNCQTFNEDDSEVGMAGHSMRKFFEKRWKDFGGNGDMSMLKTPAPSTSP